MREGWIGVSGGHGEDRKGEVITEGMGGFQVPAADARPVTGRLTKPKPHQKNIPVLVFYAETVVTVSFLAELVMTSLELIY